MTHASPSPADFHGIVPSPPPVCATAQEQKRCPRCRESKPLIAFSSRRGSKDGLDYWCRACQSACRQSPEAKERERHRDRGEYKRKRDQRPDQREKRLARFRLRDFVTRGKIIKPDHCQECKRQLPARLIHAHHSDYSRPFDVQWFCTRCHTAVHHPHAHTV